MRKFSTYSEYKQNLNNDEVLFETTEGDLVVVNSEYKAYNADTELMYDLNSLTILETVRLERQLNRAGLI
jgi:hypothetical protein